MKDVEARRELMYPVLTKPLQPRFSDFVAGMGYHRDWTPLRHPNMKCGRRLIEGRFPGARQELGSQG